MIGLGESPFRFGRNLTTTDTSVCRVDRLQDVKVKLFPGWDADVKAFSLDGFVDALRISSQHLLCSLEWGVIE